MKSLTYIIALLTWISVKAQTVRPIEQYFKYSDDNNVYFKDVNSILPKFLGSWEYSSGSEYFKITFTKYNKVSVKGTTLTHYKDKIYSAFIYKQKSGNNWVTIYDSASLNYAFIGLSIVKSTNMIELYYFEPNSTGTCERNKFGDVVLEYLLVNPNNPQLQWTREENSSGMDPNEPCPDGSPRDSSPFKIPAVMTLTKVN